MTEANATLTGGAPAGARPDCRPEEMLEAAVNRYCELAAGLGEMEAEMRDCLAAMVWAVEYGEGGRTCPGCWSNCGRVRGRIFRGNRI